MKIFGYQKHQEDDQPLLELQEVSLQLGVTEVDALIAFFIKVRSEMSKRLTQDSPALTGAHWHFQDHGGHRIPNGPDVILVADSKIEA